MIYRTHVQNKGWMEETADGGIGGTFGESKRMEAIEIELEGIEGSVQYRSHIQNYGWEKDWKADGDLSGTEGESKRLEAIQIAVVPKGSAAPGSTSNAYKEQAIVSGIGYEAICRPMAGEQEQLTERPAV